MLGVLYLDNQVVYTSFSSFEATKFYNVKKNQANCLSYKLTKSNNAVIVYTSIPNDIYLQEIIDLE